MTHNCENNIESNMCEPYCRVCGKPMETNKGKSKCWCICPGNFGSAHCDCLCHKPLEPQVDKQQEIKEEFDNLGFWTLTLFWEKMTEGEVSAHREGAIRGLILGIMIGALTVSLFNSCIP